MIGEGAGIGGRYLLDGAEVKIGRDINNEICLDDITVSRSHALVSKSDGYSIKDLGSLNGTYINAVAVRESKINPGDEVLLQAPYWVTYPEAVQIFGGYGYTKDFPVEKFYRDCKLCTIGEGTSEIQKLVISRNILKD